MNRRLMPYHVVYGYIAARMYRIVQAPFCRMTAAFVEPSVLAGSFHIVLGYAAREYVDADLYLLEDDQ